MLRVSTKTMDTCHILAIAQDGVQGETTHCFRTNRRVLWSDPAISLNID